MSISRKFFMGFSLPEEADQQARRVAEDVYKTFGIRNVLDKFIPHITLKVTFVGAQSSTDDLVKFLQKFMRGRSPIPVEVCGFGHFNIGVIYLDILQESDALTILQKELCMGLESFPWVTFESIEPNGIPHVNIAEGEIRGRFMVIYKYLTEKYPGSIPITLKHFHLFTKDPGDVAWDIGHTFELGR